jgi:hypothetical protein
MAEGSVGKDLEGSWPDLMKVPSRQLPLNAEEEMVVVLAQIRTQHLRRRRLEGYGCANPVGVPYIVYFQCRLCLLKRVSVCRVALV